MLVKSLSILISVILGSHGLIMIVKQRKWSDISGSTAIHIFNHLLMWYLFANILFILYVFVYSRFYASIIVANGEPIGDMNGRNYVTPGFASAFDNAASWWYWIFIIGNFILFIRGSITPKKNGIQKRSSKDIVYVSILIIASIILSFFSLISILLLIDEFGVVTGG